MASGSLFDRLPDDLLLAVFRRLPLLTARPAGSAVQLSSLGGVERTCRRFRRLALAAHAPASRLVLRLGVADEQGLVNHCNVAEAMERLAARGLHTVELAYYGWAEGAPCPMEAALLVGMPLLATRRCAATACCCMRPCGPPAACLNLACPPGAE